MLILMKKGACDVMFAVVFFALSSGIAAAAQPEQDKDLAAVIRVVGREASTRPEQGNQGEAKRIQIEISEGDEKISLTIPLKLFEWVIEIAGDESLEAVSRKTKFTPRELLRELKKLGKAELLEIRGGGEVIRIWLE